MKEKAIIPLKILTVANHETFLIQNGDQMYNINRSNENAFLYHCQINV